MKLRVLHVLERKHSLFETYKVRAMNIIPEVLADTPFSMLIYFLYSQEPNFPKTRVAALLARFSITPNSLSLRGREGLSIMIDIFTIHQYWQSRARAWIAPR